MTVPPPSDQNECHSLGCDADAQCLLGGGSPTCVCPQGFTGDGRLCVGEFVSPMNACIEEHIPNKTILDSFASLWVEILALFRGWSTQSFVFWSTFRSRKTTLHGGRAALGAKMITINASYESQSMLHICFFVCMQYSGGHVT